MGMGYIKLHRKLQDCWIWDSDERHNRRSAWIDILLTANHSDKRLYFNGEIVLVKRGQFITSMRKLAERWKWSLSTVSVFLNLLEADGMITRESDTHRTLITVENYSVYQDGETPTDTVASTPSDTPIDTPTDTRPSTRPSTRSETNNNEKNIKNVKNENINIYSVHFEELWSAYPRHKEKSKAYKCYQARLKDGFSEEELLTAVKNYAEECKKEHREEKYIKLCATFLGPNTPFVDYLKRGNNDDRGKAERDQEAWEREHAKQIEAVTRTLFNV